MKMIKKFTLKSKIKGMKNASAYIRMYSHENDTEEQKNNIVKLNNKIESMLKEEADKGNISSLIIKDYNNIEQKKSNMNNKKRISVKEFNIIYGISRTSQQNYRNRLNNPLPYHQTVENGNISYIKEEIDNWFDNNYK